MSESTSCPCGDSAPHVIARRRTFDGIAVDFWHDGAITGRLGRALPGVPIARPRAQAAIDLARAAIDLVAGQVEIHDLADLPRLYQCARRVAARGGLPGDLRAALAAADAPSIHFDWSVYVADRDGTPTVRVCRLDRIRWPGVAVWHERGRYEVMSITRGAALGAQPDEALTPTGFAFTSQRELIAHLLEVARPLRSSEPI